MIYELYISHYLQLKMILQILIKYTYFKQIPFPSQLDYLFYGITPLCERTFTSPPS